MKGGTAILSYHSTAQSAARPPSLTHSLDDRRGAVVLEGAVPQVELLQPGLPPARFVRWTHKQNKTRDEFGPTNQITNRQAGRHSSMPCHAMPCHVMLCHATHAPERRRQELAGRPAKAVVRQVDLHQAHQRALLRLGVHGLGEHLSWRGVVWCVWQGERRRMNTTGSRGAPDRGPRNTLHI